MKNQTSSIAFSARPPSTRACLYMAGPAGGVHVDAEHPAGVSIKRTVCSLMRYHEGIDQRALHNVATSSFISTAQHFARSPNSLHNASLLNERNVRCAFFMCQRDKSHKASLFRLGIHSSNARYFQQIAPILPDSKQSSTSRSIVKIGSVLIDCYFKKSYSARPND